VCVRPREGGLPLGSRSGGQPPESVYSKVANKKLFQAPPAPGSELGEGRCSAVTPARPRPAALRGTERSAAGAGAPRLHNHPRNSGPH